MIYILILTIFGAIVTILACKTINANFEARNELLSDREKKLYKDQEELRKKRRELKRNLENLKKELKNSSSEKKDSTPPSASLKDWLIDTGTLDPHQFKKATKYADDKNLDMISALLTLNMITVDTYEKAKKMKLR